MYNLEKKLEERKQQYHKIDCKPYKVILHMQGPVCLNDYLMLDSLLAYCVLKDILGSQFENNTNSENLHDVPLPLKRTNNIWHASAGIFDIIDTDQASWKKRWDSEHSNLVNPNKKRSGEYSLKIDVGSGNNKAYSMPLQIYLTNKIESYINGNGPEVMRLLKNYISAVGKKRSQGYGFVQKFEIKEIGKDKSILRNGELMRPVDHQTLMSEFDNQGKIKINYIRRYMPVAPPYWNASASVQAAAPKYINIQGD